MDDERPCINLVPWRVVGGFAVFCAYTVLVSGPAARAAVERAMQEEIEQENHAFCLEMGKQPGTREFGRCAAALDDVRARQDKRRAQEETVL